MKTAPRLEMRLEVDPAVRRLLNEVVAALMSDDLGDVAEQMRRRMFGCNLLLEVQASKSSIKVLGFKPYAELVLVELLAIARRPLPVSVRRRQADEVMTCGGFPTCRMSR